MDHQDSAGTRLSARARCGLPHGGGDGRRIIVGADVMMLPPAPGTVAVTVTVIPALPSRYLTQVNASPGCGITVKLMVQDRGKAAPVTLGLTTDTLPGGDAPVTLKVTGTPLTTAPLASVTSALIAVDTVPSPLLLA